MASKSNQVSLGKISGFLAFTAMIIKGVALIFALLKSEYAGTLTKIADIMLIALMFLAAWIFCLTTKLPGKKIVWQVILFVITILMIIGIIAV